MYNPHPKEIKINNVIHATLGIVEIIYSPSEHNAIVYSHARGEYFEIDVRDTDI